MTDSIPKLIRRMDGYRPGRRPSSANRRYRSDGWRVYLLQASTGQKGPELDPLELSWTTEVNTYETMSVRVQWDDLNGIQRKWYTPGWGGLLVTWTEGGVETPKLAGPITSPGDQDRDSVTYEAAGILWVLENLVIGTTLQLRNLSLGEILWRVADQNQLKPGGGLPIVNGSPDPDGRGHQRDYDSYDLQNTGLLKLMKEISAVEGGPDFVCVPEWTDRTQRFVRWVLYHGTSRSPLIDAGVLRDLDTTAAQGGISEVTVTSDTSTLVSRVWATGSGEGEGTLRHRAEDLRLVEHGGLFLETVVSDTSAQNDDPSGRSPTVGTRSVPVSLTVGDPSVRSAPRVATVRIPLALRASANRWRLHIENLNPALGPDGRPKTTRVRFGNLYLGGNWNNGGIGDSQEVADIFDIEPGSHSTVTAWSDTNISENVVFSFSYEADEEPHSCVGGGWVRTGVRDSARPGYRGMVKSSRLPFHVWVEVEADANTKSIAMLGSSSAAGVGANLPVFDSPLSWYARSVGALPVHQTVPASTLYWFTNKNTYLWRRFGDMPPVDLVLMYLGSNDVFSGASLSDMQSWFNTVTDHAVNLVGKQVHAMTIPPRTNSAPGPRETVRREFNAWLKTKPPLVTEVWDVVPLVSSDDETLLPEYDSDGMHLNAAGYRKTSEALTGLVALANDDPRRAALESKALKGLAKGTLDARVDAVDQVSVTVDARDPKNGVNHLRVGDGAAVTLKGFDAIPDGTHRMVVLKASGSLGDKMTVDFQTDTWV